MASSVSEFLKQKIEERNLSIDGFANSMGITSDLARKYLSESGRYLPSDRVAKKISMVLKLTRDEETEFLRNLDQDRDKALPVDDFIAMDETSGTSVKSSITKLWVAFIFILLISLISLGCSILTLLNIRH
jgi:hypothetical protein